MPRVATVNDVTDRPPIRRRELAAILEHLETKTSDGALVLGPGGSGKTVLLLMIRDDLQQRGRSAFYIPLKGVGRPAEIGDRILRTINDVAPGVLVSSRVLQSSTGALRTSEVVEVLRQASAHLTRPVLILDGNDQAADPVGTASTVDELARGLPGWQIVISSRVSYVRGFDRFRTFTIGGLSGEEAEALLRQWLPEATDERLAAAISISGRLPLTLALLADLGLPDGMHEMVRPFSLYGIIENLLSSALDRLPNADKLQALLERLALMGGRESITALAEWSGLAEQDIRPLIEMSFMSRVAPDIAVVHDSVNKVVVERRLRKRPFQLTDLLFGAEDAERDDLLDKSYVPRQNIGSVLDQHRSIIVGDRGSGKSALFRRLSALKDGVELFPIPNSDDLLRKIAGTTAQDADTLRAAWLVVIAAVVAAAVPDSASKKLRRDGSELRTAVGLSIDPVGVVGKTLRSAARVFGGTTLKFAVGPVNLEAQLPPGSRPSTSTVDVEGFLQELDGLLQDTNHSVVVLFDRIDELFKYDRARQEAVVQGLLQAESRIGMLGGIALVVFLRTDLFELYDIQEKNKLVSRRLMLKWSDQDWLQVLVRRVLANDSLEWVADRLRRSDGSFETLPALSVLFPAEIEGRPIDRWLVDSVRNGNGDVSPRLAVLLLHLARDYTARPSEEVRALPLFSADAAARAMTELSELSFSEVVNDFKVAQSFVLNCRAGRFTIFTLVDVEQLFDRDEGPISEQVRLLERLGFLERVVIETDTGAQPMFRIPELYTRCWDHG